MNINKISENIPLNPELINYIKRYRHLNEINRVFYHLISYIRLISKGEYIIEYYDIRTARVNALHHTSTNDRRYDSTFYYVLSYFHQTNVRSLPYDSRSCLEVAKRLNLDDTKNQDHDLIQQTEAKQLTLLSEYYQKIRDERDREYEKRGQEDSNKRYYGNYKEGSYDSEHEKPESDDLIIKNELHPDHLEAKKEQERIAKEKYQEKQKQEVIKTVGLTLLSLLIKDKIL